MNLKKFFGLIMFFALMTGYVSTSFAKTYTSKEEIIKKTKITSDNFKKETHYAFPAINYNDFKKEEKLQYIPDWKNPDVILKNNPIMYEIIAITNSKKNTQTFMFNVDFYSDYENPWVVTEMYDSNGDEIIEYIESIKISLIIGSFKKDAVYLFEGIAKAPKYVDDCKIEIKKEYLEKNKEEGIVIRATTSNKEYRYFHVPSFYIQAVLETVK